MYNKLLYLSLTCAGTVLASCAQQVEEDKALKEKLRHLADNVLTHSAPVYFSLDSLTTYPWEEALFLTPYTSLDKVNPTIPADLTPLKKTGIELDDSKTVLAFIKAGKLVSYVEVPRQHGDFAKLPDSARVYYPGRAAFRMVKERGWAVVQKVND
ncbi:hypothetical protein [Rufibacter psychrotolerans]|uniref:hypothetical protein n=1 Tax=Rufibacter psychrotolerans TaxID=2812556 RepID=UPI001968801B|nr:hypothetical protein [Rufibacter sp. SYSU D00308]